MREERNTVSAKDAEERISSFMAAIVRLMHILVRGP
jgi:hypothetical protein